MRSSSQLSAVSKKKQIGDFDRLFDGDKGEAVFFGWRLTSSICQGTTEPSLRKAAISPP